jgi:hypothetical protein
MAVKFPTEPDGTFAIPWWVRLALRFVPEPFRSLVEALIDILDKLPAPKQAGLIAALKKGDATTLTRELHACTVGCGAELKKE